MILRGYGRSRWPDKNGSILILAFWALVLLASLALMMAAMTRQRLDLTMRAHDYAVWRAASQAGVYRLKSELAASCGDVNNGWLHEWLAYANGFDGELKNGTRFVLFAFDEERRLNINTAPRDVLARLLVERCQISVVEAEAMADAVIDWRDADHDPGPKGAEDPYYQSLPAPYEAKDAFFNSVEELLLVRGFAGKIYDKISFYVTVCGAGAVNINTASVPVLLSLGLSASLVERIQTYFDGEDGQRVTDDDRCFIAPSAFDAQAEVLVEISPEENKQMEDLVAQGLLNVISRNFSAESRGMGRRPGAPFVTRAVYRVSPSEQGGCAVDLVWWRTGA